MPAATDTPTTGPAVATRVASATDERLLAVAEGLFAEHGIHAVSVRSITVEAGANIAAVHYHFGTKLDLIRALVERRVDEVNATRLVLLRDVERRAEVTARDVAGIWVEPLARLALDPTRRAYLGFVVALQNAGPAMRALSSDVFRPHFSRLDAALARALPQVDSPLRRARFGLGVDMSMRALADLGQLAGPWLADDREVDPRTLVDTVVDAFTGLLEGGATQPVQHGAVPSPTRRRRTRA